MIRLEFQGKLEPDIGMNQPWYLPDMKIIFVKAFTRSFHLPVSLSVVASRAGERLARGRRGFRIYQRQAR